MTLFWAIYAVVIALCVATVMLSGRARLITFAIWFVAIILDVIILVRAK